MTGTPKVDKTNAIPESTVMMTMTREPDGNHHPPSSTTRFEEEYLDEEHPLVSKDSNASLSQALVSSSTETLNSGEVLTTRTSGATKEEDKQVLVSDPSKESPNHRSTEAKRPREDGWQQRPPLTLLSSPETPEDLSNKRGTGWGDHTRRGAEETKRPSPTNGWPQRSPIKPETGHEHEVASFTLFTNSFDTLSETGNYFRDIDQAPHHERQYYASPSEKPRGGRNHRDEPPKKIDLSLRDHDAESSVGDISPIKLDDSNMDQSSHHRSEPRQLYNQRYQPNSHPSVEVDPTPQYDGHLEFRESPYERTSPYGYGRETSGYPGYEKHPSNPFFVLRSVHKAFDGCYYMLPCLRDRDICPVNLSQYANIRHYHDQKAAPESQDIQIATRRVEAAIHAFGGYSKPKQMLPHQPTSIFRLKGHRKTPSKEFYEERFHQRYFVSGNHISWEMEESPPVMSTHNGNGSETQRRVLVMRHGKHNDGDTPDYIEDQSYHSDPMKSNSGDSSPNSMGSVIPSENQHKIKYRCKLCGQPKQNHNCSYQQSLQRSIAVMVYPVVNAFTAREPGILTKSLSEMNNFVSYDSGKGSLDTDYSHAEGGGRHGAVPISHITPETKTRLVHSPESSLSTHSVDPSPDRNKGSDHFGRVPRNGGYFGAAGHDTTRKRTHVHLSQNEGANTSGGEASIVQTPQKTVVETLTLRPEHYRAVTARSTSEEPANEYQYPPVPLTFKERKRLSDTLFFLSKEIPTMARDVAASLRGGRKRDEWDLAVAELLTQVVVGVYCGEGDHRLDGLHHFLLGIGISC